MKKVLKVFKVLFIALGILLACIVLIFILGAGALSKANKEYESNKVEVDSPNGDKKAFIIYQPAAKSDVVEKVTKGLSEGLSEQGYDVCIDYCGKHISADLSEYDVVVYGGATYAGHISTVLLDTVTKVTAYKDEANVFVFSTGMMDTETEIDEVVKKANRSVQDTKKFKASDKDISTQAKNWANNF